MFSPRKNAEIRTRRSSDCASPISSVATCSSPTICTTASGRTICRSPSQTCRKHRSFTRSFCEKIFPEAYRASSTSAAAPDTMPNCCSPAGIRSIASRRALISPPSPGKSSGSTANCTNAPSKSCRPAASTTVCSSARAFSTSIWIPYFYACRNF